MKKVKHTLLSVVLIVLIVLFSFSSCFLIKRSISPVTDVSSVSAGYYHTMILRKGGTLWAAGSNDHGQLGDGTTINSSKPVQVMESESVGMTDVAAISAGGDHTMILKNDGTLWGTGHNEDGQLGDGTDNNTSTLVQVKQQD